MRLRSGKAGAGRSAWGLRIRSRGLWLLLTGAMALAITACGTVADQRDAAPPVSREQAIQQAMEEVKRPWPEVTGVESPRDPEARLMTLDDYEREFAGEVSLNDHTETPVWVVQVEGMSESAGIVPEHARTEYHYAIAVIDARTGDYLRGSREEKPIFGEEAAVTSVTPTPAPSATRLPPDDDGTRHDSESSEEAHEFMEEEVERGRVRSSSGPSTRGGTVRIDDRPVDLPEDAYISKRWHAGMCEDPDNCPPFPWVEITRGDSTVLIGADGAVVEKDIAPGDEATFDFIWEALGTPPYPTPVPAGG